MIPTMATARSKRWCHDKIESHKMMGMFYAEAGSITSNFEVIKRHFSKKDGHVLVIKHWWASLRKTKGNARGYGHCPYTHSNF
jgi:hypothetical protein